MADLGEFGRARAAEYEAAGEPVEPDTFRLDGETFTVVAALSPLVLMEFAHAVKAGQAEMDAASAAEDRARAALETAATQRDRDAAEADLIAAQTRKAVVETTSAADMYAYIRASVGDQEWPRFRAAVMRLGLHTDELMDICAAIFSAVAGRPTVRPSRSSGGPSNGGATSTGGVVSPGVTPGPSLPGPGSPEPVRPLTDAERQRAEFAALMAPVGDLLTRSGG